MMSHKMYDHKLEDSSIVFVLDKLYFSVGKGSANTPKTLFNCISRSNKGLNSDNSFPTNKNNLEFFSNHSSMEKTLLDSFDLKCHDKSLTFSINNTASEKHDSVFDSFKFDEKQNVYYFSQAIEASEKDNFKLNFPFVNGFFNESLSPTYIQQDLEDMWQTAIEKYLFISKSSFPSYTFVLVLETVYKRKEIKWMVEVIIERLKFKQVLVQLKSACVAYGIGLPNMCVIDVGNDKTSVCCIEEGVPYMMSNILIPVGVENSLFCLQNYCGKNDLPAATLNDLKDYSFLEKFYNELNATGFNSLEENNVILDSLNWEKNKHSISLSEIKFPMYFLHLINIWPYVKLEKISPRFQALYSELSEPDDPFDESYLFLASKDKRFKKTQFQSVIDFENKGDSDDGKSKEEPALSATKVKELSIPRQFNSLADAVWWSVCQYGQSHVEMNLNSNVSSSTQAVQQGNSDSQVESQFTAMASGEEMMKRQLGAIHLVGPGAMGVAGRSLEKWLCGAVTRLADSNQTWLTGGPTIEVVSHPRTASDLLWRGIRLLLQVESVQDVVVSAELWKKHGTRALRERVPFCW